MNTPGEASIKVPFNRPSLVGRELEYIARAVELGNIACDGEFTRRCAELLEQRFGLAHVVMTHSATAALDLAALLCDLNPGDEVVLPSYTFVSTANAVLNTGGKPVFVDIRSDTLNLDEALVAGSITPRTRAIFAVHYAGVGCELNALSEIAKAHDLLLIEDAAQGVDAYYHDRPLGSIGHLAAYSFHEAKNFMGGQAGALVVNDLRFLRRAEILRDKGTNRAAYFRGEVEAYEWRDRGSAFAPSELACAYLCAQLEKMDVISARRREIDDRYYRALRPLEDRGDVVIPRPPAHCRSNHHIFFMLVDTQVTRDRLMRYLREQGIWAPFHYVPLHSSPMGTRLGYRKGMLPRTENLASRLIRLPFFFDLTAEQQTYVINHVLAFFGLHGSDKEHLASSPGGRAD